MLRVDCFPETANLQPRFIAEGIKSITQITKRVAQPDSATMRLLQQFSNRSIQFFWLCNFFHCSFSTAPDRVANSIRLTGAVSFVSNCDSTSAPLVMLLVW